MLRLLSVVAVGALGVLGQTPPKLPTLPTEYSAVILMKMPYIPLEMPLRVLTSTTAQKVSYYNGLQVITSSAKGTYKYQFNNSERVCSFSPATAGPTSARRLQSQAFTPAAFLPNLSKYTQEADENVGGIMCNKFSLSAIHGTEGTMDDHYYFYWDPVMGKPVRWHMHARLIPFGSHTDEYIMDFLDFEAGTPNAADVALEKMCTEQPTETHISAGLGNFLKAAQAQAETSKNFEAYLKEHGKSYGAEEQKVRAGIFAKNLLLVEELNQKHAGRATFKLNKFMDLSKDEIMSFRGGKNKGSSKNRRTKEHQKYVRAHKAVGTSALPTDFDWRTERPGVVSYVKDQAFCGSCWAYGAMEPIESAVALQTKNNLVVLPEQFMVDCTWTNGTGDSGSNSGCDGGDSDIGALEIVRKYDGVIPSALAYGSYLGANGYCKDTRNMQVGAKVTGWVDTKTRNDTDVMNALVANGPLSIGIQVPAEMLYYDRGVLNVASCKADESQIDHAVSLVGYGTVQGVLGQPDQDYWLVRNSWSTYWGDQGYIKIARGAQDCCVACQAGYPEVAPALSASVIV